jgi:hypothetical protein
VEEDFEDGQGPRRDLETMIIDDDNDDHPAFF